MTPDKPRCGATIEGPIVRDRGRSRPLWRRGCRRFVAAAGERCYQHRRPSLGESTPTQGSSK